MNEIIGKTIKSIEMTGDESITFVDSEGNKYSYESYGDCCSTTWISHISGVKALLGHTVKEIKDRKFSEEDQERAEKDGGSYDSLELYGYDIVTDGGICALEFRNDSNGYYGGSLDHVSPIEKNDKLIDKDF